MTKTIPVNVAVRQDGKDYFIECEGFETKAKGLVVAPSQNPRWKWVLIHADSGLKIGHFSMYKNTLFNLAKSISYLDWTKPSDEIVPDKRYLSAIYDFYKGE